jgi:hypothetical protein
LLKMLVIEDEYIEALSHTHGSYDRNE